MKLENDASEELKRRVVSEAVNADHESFKHFIDKVFTKTK